MKKKLFVFMSLMIISLCHVRAEVMVNDTIDNRTTQIVVTMPEKYVKYCTKFVTTEGPVYSYYIGNNAVLDISLCSGLDHISKSDTIFTRCKIGNIAESVTGCNARGYFRHDFYLKYGVTVSYKNVPEDMLQYANSLLDNIRVLTHNLKPLSPKTRKTKIAF